MRGQKRVEDARKRAYDAAHLIFCAKNMDCQIEHGKYR